MVQSKDMIEHTSAGTRIGYTRYEFGKIFQIYSRNVYTGLFRDFSFADLNGRYYISFREEAGKIPLITIEKQRLGPDRALFIATTPAPGGKLAAIARSEKIEAFTDQLNDAVDRLRVTQRTRAK